MLVGPPEQFLTASAMVFKPVLIVKSLIVGDVRPSFRVGDEMVWLLGGPAPGGWPPEKVGMANSKVYLKQQIDIELKNRTS